MKIMSKNLILKFFMRFLYKLKIILIQAQLFKLQRFVYSFSYNIIIKFIEYFSKLLPLILHFVIITFLFYYYILTSYYILQGFFILYANDHLFET